MTASGHQIFSTTLTDAIPADIQARLFSVVPHWRLAGLDPPNGANHLRAALAILRPLADADRLDANRLNWIPQIEAQLASAK
jgi:hypothetical protein